MVRSPQISLTIIHQKTLIAILCGVVYLMLPSVNPTLDAMGYAGDIKWGTQLFAPHHLLYNAFGWLLYQGTSVFGEVDALSLMQALNALVAGACVWVLGSILQRRGLEKAEVIAWMLFAGGSFGLLRFATDNETYLVPLLLSLLASRVLFFHTKPQSRKAILLAGFLAVLACLFHQLHVWWWLGLCLSFVFVKDWKSVLWYVFPVILVPLAYGAVLSNQLGTVPSLGELISFGLHDFAREEVSVDLGVKSLVLTPISLFRTFFQVHGSVWLFVQNIPILWLSVVVTIVMLGKGLLRKWPIRFFKNWGDHFAKTHVVILALHFAFAMLSHGNAEFMVMIPFLFPFAQGFGFKANPKAVIWLAGAFWMWNLSLAIIPQHVHKLYDNEAVVEAIHQYPQAHFILADKHQIANRYFYQYGDTIYQRLHDFPPRDEARVCSLSQAGVTILSDVPDRPVMLSRGSLLNDQSSDSFTKEEKVQDLNGFVGKYGLWRVGWECE